MKSCFFFSEIEAKQEADLALRNSQIELRSVVSRVKEVCLLAVYLGIMMSYA